ncbi:MAG: alpha-amylase family glycosyl hydrolase [Spirochaetia bacterium]|nr:alpha-amylase family glycosyl hydrolase [Spirochaetia bacterium]
MKEVLNKFHTTEYIDKTLDEIKDILLNLYGREQGLGNYNYLITAAGSFLESLSKNEISNYASFNSSKPYEHLKGKIFAISYPDNIYDDKSPTLQTLGTILSEYFPYINGIHILPERIMSHGDVWPQDFFSFMPKENALELVHNLQKSEVLDKDRYITSIYQDNAESFKTNLPEEVVEVLDKAFNSHFNDGGFSQATRAKVDPRFGTVEDIRNLTKNYSVMLDYVVNHVDIDSDILESYKEGKNSGDAFIIITPEEYVAMKSDGSLYKTFRPRPFPLYTGMRKYTKQEIEMNNLFLDKGLKALDDRVVRFLSIYFKVENDQGLTAEDKRTFAAFQQWLRDNKIDDKLLFNDSQLQANQKIIWVDEIGSMGEFLKAIGINSEYMEIFNRNDDAVFGEKFFVYTTFSESQADINPMTRDGFKMIIDDLYHLLSSGKLSMMRMDAIKYLWKEKGKKNFDMEEGNKFIDFMRKLMALTSPGVLPLDEINSPDAIVYEMSKGGVFAYVFGPVNSTVTAFNECTLQPLINYYELFKKKVPDNFVPFVMLSTHDGRSVQGLGVHRTDGHVSIGQFYNLKNRIEKQGGRAKFRSVPIGEIPADTFNKIIIESGLVNYKDELLGLFTADSVTTDNIFILKKDMLNRDNLLKKIAEISGLNYKILIADPSIDYFLNWIIDGKTIYELCATTRSSLTSNDISGLVIDPSLEASRLALAQAFVLTIGQSVPAIYFNDLLGIKNDQHGFEISGKPRDLNRHKNYLPNMKLSDPVDPFQKAFFPLINKITELRCTDNAFYPGSEDFEFIALTDTLFLNHPFHKRDHSLILGNISEKAVTFNLDLSTLQGADNNWLNSKKDTHFVNGFTGAKILINDQGSIDLELPPYGMLWLK